MVILGTREYLKLRKTQGAILESLGALAQAMEMMRRDLNRQSASSRTTRSPRDEKMEVSYTDPQKQMLEEAMAKLGVKRVVLDEADDED